MNDKILKNPVVKATYDKSDHLWMLSACEPMDLERKYKKRLQPDPSNLHVGIPIATLEHNEVEIFTKQL